MDQRIKKTLGLHKKKWNCGVQERFARSVPALLPANSRPSGTLASLSEVGFSLGAPNKLLDRASTKMKLWGSVRLEFFHQHPRSSLGSL
jgi:hypothetical protein